jgi:sugar phosphate isomerase/epimerase
MNTPRINRRSALASIGGGLIGSSAWRALAADPKRIFKIGACDWSIHGRGDVAAMKMAKEIGLDGVEVSFGRPSDKYDFRKAENREQYQAEAKKHDVVISSLAMGVLNRVPYATSSEAEQWVLDCIEVMPKLDQKVVLLAFFADGDLKGKKEMQDAVIQRLKKAAPKAEAAGVVLGIESYLNANEHLRILDAVDSPAVKVYYDVANMNEMGYDIYQEIQQLGRDRICQIHCKENGYLLGQGEIDFLKVKEALDVIGWQGWLIIEGAVPQGGQMFDSYVKNQKLLRSVFPTG